MIDIDWKKSYKIGEFACPNQNCNARNVRLSGSGKKGKRKFYCPNCGISTVQSIDLTAKVLSQFSGRIPIEKEFSFEDEVWDLRTVTSSYHERVSNFTVNFATVHLAWFREYVKKYIYQLCKLNKSFSYIITSSHHLRIFSQYLNEKDIQGISEINRCLIIDFMVWDKSGHYGRRNRLLTLRDFFITGTIKDFFNLEQYLIRKSDLPKQIINNPDSISNLVQQEIEKRLYKIPDPIARMWFIAFFTAMRPNELAFLSKNCLIQEGGSWKIVWQRNKTQDQHEIPITRIIAKVVQEQQKYIQDLWGDEWSYLFCDYQYLSKTDLSQPNLKPVKKVIHKSHNPLNVIIRCLIKAENIQDENGNLARFSSCLVRPTRLTQLFEQGHDLAVVSAWAGHKRLVTTSTYYTYISCDLIEKEAGHIQKALLNADGKPLYYESLPKSFWENPMAHQLELSGDHINTPIYGYCGLPLDELCEKFRACYTCRCFVAVPEKLPQYIKVRDELRAKESKAKVNGQDVLVEQFGRQSDQLDKIIASLQEAA